MMKCSILTFHSVYNYGAVLQAYALKKYVSSKDIQVDFINYVPKKILNVYSLNPFRKPFGVRTCVRRIRNLKNQKSQKQVFDSFFKTELGCDINSVDEKNYYNSLKESDIAICGSDQIWNDTITGEIKKYYLEGEFPNLRKVSYAASFGKKTLSNFQKNCIKECLPQFDSISLREEDGKAAIEQAIDQSVSVVLDPVFLLPRETWIEMADNIQIPVSGKYVLFYALKKNRNLEVHTQKLSETLGFPVYIIHPTGVIQSVKGKQLFNVGPVEFLKLIKDAECVCTNSFHATAFSIIFRKKYFHIPDISKETRVESLLSRINCSEECEITINNIKLIDFKNFDDGKLNQLAEESRAYLRKIFK